MTGLFNNHSVVIAYLIDNRFGFSIITNDNLRISIIINEGLGRRLFHAVLVDSRLSDFGYVFVSGLLYLYHGLKIILKYYIYSIIFQ